MIRVMMICLLFVCISIADAERVSISAAIGRLLAGNRRTGDTGTVDGSCRWNDAGNEPDCQNGKSDRV